MLIGSVALASIFVAPASAADKGFYVAATLGKAEESPKSSGVNFSFGAPPEGVEHIEPDRIDVDDGSLAWGVALGYRINQYLAAEVEYMDFGSTDIAEHYDLGASAFPFPTEFTQQYSSKVAGPAMSVLGSVPVGKGFCLFLRAGVLFADRDVELEQYVGAAENTFGSTVWLGGAGVEWSFANRWAIRAEYQQTGKLDESIVAGETELSRFSLGALFRL
jgi:opacity protein-like surface antigen